jgi:exoribonuclease R
MNLPKGFLPGDIVDIQEGKYSLLQRQEHRLIPGILELNSKYIYGHSTRGNKIYLFYPLDPAYPPFRVGSSAKDTSKNLLALIDFTHWEEEEKFPKGSLVRILGPCGDAKAELESITYQYSQPRLAKGMFEMERPETPHRPLLDGFTFNVDPEGCKDIDDVFTIKQLSENEYKFIITIADVSAHIYPKSIGDQHAYQLGQTLYQNGTAVVPMFPPLFSEILFSLIPEEKRLGLSLHCRWTGNALVMEGFQETIVKNSKTFTYNEIQKDPLGSLLQEITSFLKGSPCTDSHEWVEQCMIFYNKEVAKILLEHNLGLLRSHTSVDLEKLERYESIHSDLRFLAFPSAKYELTHEGIVHASLGSVPYTHATSPIRRYADILAQRALKQCLGFPELGSPKPQGVLGPEIPHHLNKIQKKHKQYEKTLFFLQKILEQKTGKIQGIVLECNEEFCKTYIPEWKRILKTKDKGFSPKDTVTVEYYADLQKPQWQDRLVYNLMR